MAIYKRGRIYWFKFKLNGTLIRGSCKTSNQRMAKSAEAIRRLELVAGEIGIVDSKIKARTPAMRFSEAVEYLLNWLSVNRQPKTLERNRTASKALMRHFGDMRIDRITPADCEAFKIKRMKEKKLVQGRNPKDGRAKKAHKPITETVSAVTVSLELACLTKLFNLLVEKDILKASPAARVGFLKHKRRRHRVVTYEEEREYLFACPEPLRDFATLMLETGMRPVEVRALRVEDVHLKGEEAWLHVRQSKTEASMRDMFNLSPKAVEVLRKRLDMAENGILFFETRGHVDNRHRTVLKTLNHIKPFRLYDLRHTFATRQVEARTDLPTLAALMGHANIKETMRYAHPSDVHKSAAMGKMQEMRLEWERQQTQKTA